MICNYRKLIIMNQSQMKLNSKIYLQAMQVICCCFLCFKTEVKEDPVEYTCASSLADTIANLLQWGCHLTHRIPIFQFLQEQYSGKIISSWP